MSSKSIRIGTDVATFVFFHPDDVQAHEHSPIAWYAYSFCYQPLNQQGLLFGLDVGGDGGYDFRLTTEDLTEREKVAQVAGCEFVYHCRHGSIFVDNTDGLPGQEKMHEPKELPDYWFDLEEGYYRVVVTPLAWESDEDYQQGPDFVVQFFPIDDVASYQAAPTPMSVRRHKDFDPRPMEPMPLAPSFEFCQREWGEPIVGVDDVQGIKFAVGNQLQLNLNSERWKPLFFGRDVALETDLFFLAESLQPGALGLVVEGGNPSGGSNGLRVWTRILGFAQLRGVRERVEDWPVLELERVPLPENNMVMESSYVKTTLLEALADNPQMQERCDGLYFETLLLESLEDQEAMLAWVVKLLDFDLAEAMAFLQMNSFDKFVRVTQKLGLAG